MKNALCLFAIGKKYEKILEKNISQFEIYAKKCNAELVIINEPLDKTFKRTLLYQKLLVPSHLEKYNKVVFLDLDIVISKNCPSLFDLLPDDKGLAAVYSPRGTEKFKLMWKNHPDILNETVETYFTKRNFPKANGLTGNINGGVLVFNPSKIGKLFKDYYFSNHEQGEHSAFEEAPMAFISQTNNLFFPLTENYNRQFFYEFYTPKCANILKIKSKAVYKIINQTLQKIFKLDSDILLYKKMNKLRNFLIEKDNTFILHFSGKTSKKLYTEDLFLNEK